MGWARRYLEVPLAGLEDVRSLLLRVRFDGRLQSTSDAGAWIGLLLSERHRDKVRRGFHVVRASSLLPPSGALVHPDFLGSAAARR